MKKAFELFDLVITDQTMPRITGIELACGLLEIRPDIPIIFCTEFSEQISSKIETSAGDKEICHEASPKKGPYGYYTGGSGGECRGNHCIG